LNVTSWPVTRPSPPVVWFGFGWMPLSTELFGVNEVLTTAAMNERPGVGPAPSRVVNATSDGELTRVRTIGVENVGAPDVRPTSESVGKTR
jgi:hypothetical protein